MKFLKPAIIALLFVFNTTLLSAHALWIETAANGKAGQAHSVKLFYGEYAANEREELDKWRSDLKELTVWLVTPDGKKEKLATTGGANFTETTFTPKQDGLYTLAVSHKLKEIDNGLQIEFLASSTVLVGKPGATALNAAANSSEVKVFPENGTSWNANKPLKLKVLVKDEAKKGISVMVFSPSGWSKELSTAEDGTVAFTPLWPGNYVIEASTYNKTEGETNGNKYTALWQGATYSFAVGK